MSIDTLAFIIENAYAVKFKEWAFGMVVHFQLRKDESWHQIELDTSVWAVLNSRYKRFIEKWENVE